MFVRWLKASRVYKTRYAQRNRNRVLALPRMKRMRDISLFSNWSIRFLKLVQSSQLAARLGILFMAVVKIITIHKFI